MSWRTRLWCTNLGAPAMVSSLYQVLFATMPTYLQELGHVVDFACLLVDVGAALRTMDHDPHALEKVSNGEFVFHPPSPSSCAWPPPCRRSAWDSLCVVCKEVRESEKSSQLGLNPGRVVLGALHPHIHPPPHTGNTLPPLRTSHSPGPDRQLPAFNPQQPIERISFRRISW